MMTHSSAISPCDDVFVFRRLYYLLPSSYVLRCSSTEICIEPLPSTSMSSVVHLDITQYRTQPSPNHLRAEVFFV